MWIKTHRYLVCMKDPSLINASSPRTYKSRYNKEIKPLADPGLLLLDTDSQCITDTNSTNQFPYRTVSHRCKRLNSPIYHSPEHLAFCFQSFFLLLFCLKKQMSLASDQFGSQVCGWVAYRKHNVTQSHTFDGKIGDTSSLLF